MSEETTESRLTRIESLYNQGLKHAAAQLSRLVLEKDPTNVRALVWLARSSTQPDEVEKAVRRASQLQPDDPQVRELVATRQPSYAGTVSYNPYAVPSGGFNSNVEPKGAAQSWSSFTNSPAPEASTFTAPPPPVYSAPQPSSSYDYLKNLSASVPTSVPPATPVSTPIKVRSTVSVLGIIFGLIFLLVGLGLAGVWTYLIFDNTSDLSQTASQLQGQIVKLSSNPAQLVVDVANGGQRTFDIPSQMSTNLVPLVSANNSLVGNTVILNVTPKGHLTSVDVMKPTGGHVDGNYGLLGYGQAVDWVVTAVGALLAIIGLILLGRSLGKRRT